MTLRCNTVSYFEVLPLIEVKLSDSYTVSDKSYVGEHFHSSLHNVGKIIVVLLLTKTEITFYVHTGTQNCTYKISCENFFVVCRKSTKTMKIFFHITFTIYDSYCKKLHMYTFMCRIKW